MANRKLDRTAIISLALAKLITLIVFFAVAAISGYLVQMIQVMGDLFFNLYLLVEIVPLVAMRYEFLDQGREYTVLALFSQFFALCFGSFLMGFVRVVVEEIDEISFSVKLITLFVPLMNFDGQLVLAAAIDFAYRRYKKMKENSSEESLLI